MANLLLLIVLAFQPVILLLIWLNRPQAGIDKQALNELEERLNREIKSNKSELATLINAMQTQIFNDLTKLQLDLVERSRLSERALTESLIAFKQGVDSALNNELNKLIDKHDKLFELTRQELERIRGSVEEKLEKTISQKISTSFQNVVDNLLKVQSGLSEMQSLAKGVGDLQRVLSQPKTRGVFGEIQLQAILEDVLVKGSQFEVNVKPDPNSQKVVEFAVIIHKDYNRNKIYLPIDSKFPLDRFDELSKAYDSNDKGLKDEALKNLFKAIELQAKSIAEYIVPPFTADFAVLYLPTESLYMEVIRSGRLQEEVFQKYRVMITGPTTLSAFLNALRMGLQSLEIHYKSKEIWDLLRKVKDEFNTFQATLDDTKKHLNKASESVDNLITTRSRKLLNALKSVDSESPPTIDRSGE